MTKEEFTDEYDLFIDKFKKYTQLLDRDLYCAIARVDTCDKPIKIEEALSRVKKLVMEIEGIFPDGVTEKIRHFQIEARDIEGEADVETPGFKVSDLVDCK